MMFERLTQRARQVMVLGQDEARTLKHSHIGTEHILLGLLREEEGLAARVLESLDVTVEEVRAHVARIVGHGDAVTTGQLPFTPRLKRVLDLALREALSLGHNYIGTEHILLGLVRENEGVGARILVGFGASPENIRNEIIRMLTGPKQSKSAVTAIHTDIYVDGEEVARHVARHQQRLHRRNPSQRRGPSADVDVSAFTPPDHNLVYESGNLRVSVHTSGLSDPIWNSIRAAVITALNGPNESAVSA